MLSREDEISVAAHALEAGIRDPNRPRVHFENILRDFYSGTEMQGLRIIDLGPGHYDFAELIQQYGSKVDAIEIDPAVIKLGELKKIKVYEGDLREKSTFAPLSGVYDGIFCRGSINCSWFLNDPTAHVDYLHALLLMASQSGPCWISPCNEPTGIDDSDFKKCLTVQIDFFIEHGFEVLRCGRFEANEYGVWSNLPRLIYTKNLSVPLVKPPFHPKQTLLYSMGRSIWRRFHSLL